MKKIFLILTLLISVAYGQVTNITGSNPQVVFVPSFAKMGATDSFLVKHGSALVLVQRDSTGITGGGGGGISTVNVTAPVTGGGSTSTITVGLDTVNWHSLNYYNTQFVHLTGNETIAGTKTFSTSPTFSSEANTQILYSNSGAVTSNANFLWQNSLNRLVIGGASASNEQITITRNYGSIAGDGIVLSDNNSSGKITIGDAASSGFAPYFTLKADGTTQNTSIFQANANNSGSTAALQIRATNLAGSGTLGTQPLFDFQNFTTSYMKMEAGGLLGIGLNGTAATSTLQVNGQVAINGEGALTSASGSIANSETKILSSDLSMAANRLVAGTVVEIILHGTCTSTAAGAGTVNVRYGTAATTADGLLQSFTLGAAQTSGTTIPFTLHILITIRTTGASATSDGELDLINQGTTGISTTDVEVIRGSATNINTTTAATFFTVSYQSGNASTAATFQDAVIKFSYK